MGLHLLQELRRHEAPAVGQGVEEHRPAGAVAHRPGALQPPDELGRGGGREGGDTPTIGAGWGPGGPHPWPGVKMFTFPFGETYT